MADAGYIFGWDEVNNTWRKVLVDADGKLIIGDSVIIDNDPVEGNEDHAISSDWSFRHSEDADAHHTPPVAGDFNHNDLANIGASDHHVKYTDAEALAACKLNGTLYTGIPGCSFIGQQSFSDDINYSVTSGAVTCAVNDCALIAQVNLPNGATVTGVVVYGNAGAQAETWELRRVKLSDASNLQMATAAIGTEDTTISSEVIDNSQYAYFIITSTLDTGDSVYGARVSFTV